MTRRVLAGRQPPRWALTTASFLAIAQLASQVGYAAEGQAGLPVQAERNFTFDIPSLPLPQAIARLSAITNVQALYAEPAANHIVAPALSGQFTTGEALIRLLAGSGLVARFTSANAVTIERPNAAAQQGGTIQLPALQIEGAGDQAYAPVDGYVATQSGIATKTSTPIQETPQSISVISKDVMEARGVQTDAQALLYTPGVWAQPFGGNQDPNNPFFYIRGFSSAFGGSYVDGLQSPVNYRYEPFDTERIDVFRGPVSTLYGQSDPGGIVNRTTKRPPEEYSGEVQVQGGTFEHKQLGIDVGGPVDQNRKVLFRINGVLRDSNSDIDYEHGREEPDDRVYVAPSLTVKPGEDTQLTVMMNYLDETTDSISVMRDATGAMTRVDLDQPGYGVYDYTHFMLGYALEHDFGDDLAFRQNTRWSRMDNERVGLYQRSINTATQTVNRSVASFLEDRNDFAIDTQLEKRFETGRIEHTVLAGHDYQRLSDDYTFTWSVAPSLNYVTPNYSQVINDPEAYSITEAETSDHGIYLQEQAKIDQKWVVTLGLRNDWSERESIDKLTNVTTTRRDTAFTYRAGVNYLMDSGVSPYASYATSFNPADGSDRSGKPFEPTTGTQYEVGVKFQPKGVDALFSLSAYQLTRENVTTPDPNDRNFSVQTGEVRSRGLELEGVFDLETGLRGTLGYSYNHAEVTKDNANSSGVSKQGKRPNLTPKHMASAWLDYTFQDGLPQGLTLGGGVRYIGGSFGDAQNTIRNEQYTLADATIRYDLGQIHDDLVESSLALNANNLFDKEYVTCINSFDCNWGAARTITLTYSKRW